MVTGAEISVLSSESEIMNKLIAAGIGQAAKDTIIAVDAYPEYGLKKKVEEIISDGGGPVANAIYTLAKLGIDTRISTVIGDDPEGNYILSQLKIEKIDTRFVIKRKNAASHVAYIIVEKKSGERTIFYKLCSGREIEPDELSMEFFRNISFLHLDGFQEEISVFAAKYANKHSIPVMLDAGSYRSYMERIIRNTDYLVTSSVFAEKYGFDGSIKKFRELAAYFKRPHLTVTMGEKGSFTFHKGMIFRTPAYRLKILDTTGAGDVFHGAMIYGIMKKFDIAKSVRFATVVASLKCRDFGGRRGIPSLKEALWHLKKFKEITYYF